MKFCDSQQKMFNKMSHLCIYERHHKKAELIYIFLNGIFAHLHNNSLYNINNIDIKLKLIKKIHFLCLIFH